MAPLISTTIKLSVLSLVAVWLFQPRKSSWTVLYIRTTYGDIFGLVSRESDPIQELFIKHLQSILEIRKSLISNKRSIKVLLFAFRVKKSRIWSFLIWSIYCSLNTSFPSRRKENFTFTDGLSPYSFCYRGRSFDEEVHVETLAQPWMASKQKYIFTLSNTASGGGRVSGRKSKFVLLKLRL